MECLVCYEEINQTQLEAQIENKICECHICNSCQSNWIIAQIQDISYNIGDILKCPHCELQFQIQDKLAMEFTSKELKDQISDILLKKYLRNSSDYYPCPGQGCDNFGFLRNKCNKTEKITCDSCNHIYQLKKKEKLNLKQCVSSCLKNTLSSIRTYMTSRRCPKCSINIVKNGGCMHMTCAKCKHDFCWKCNQNWRSHREWLCLIVIVLEKIKWAIYLSILIAIVGVVLYFFGVFGSVIEGLKIVFGGVWYIIKIVYKYILAYNLFLAGLGMQGYILAHYFGAMVDNIGYRQKEALLYNFLFLGLNWLHYWIFSLSGLEFSLKTQMITISSDFAVLLGFKIMALFWVCFRSCVQEIRTRGFMKVCKSKATSHDVEMEVFERRKQLLIEEINRKNQENVQNNNINIEIPQENQDIQIQEQQCVSSDNSDSYNIGNLFQDEQQSEEQQHSIFNIQNIYEDQEEEEQKIDQGPLNIVSDGTTVQYIFDGKKDYVQQIYTQEINNNNIMNSQQSDDFQQENQKIQINQPLIKEEDKNIDIEQIRLNVENFV